MIAAALAALVAAAPAAGEPAPPNIVLAIADDLDPDHLGFAGNALARTPHLDELARAGAVFPTLWVQAVCRPSLATLLTGRWPHETGILGNLTRATLAPEGALPALLAARGYATYCAGKFWEGDVAAYGFGAPPANDERFARDRDVGQNDLFAFLEEHAQGGPWFVWWAPSLPHTPHRPPVRFANAFAETPIPLPRDYAGDAEEFAETERACLAMEAWLDAELGRLRAKLRELGELDDTLILFLADNGWSTASAAKGTPREKGVRSPLVVARPGEEAPRRFDALVDLVDVHATVLDYAGVPLPATARGRSLRPLLEGGAYEPRAQLCGAVFARGAGRAGDELPYALYARDARWKYVLYLRDVRSESLSPGGRLAPPFRFDAGEEELFDLVEDPGEEVDLAARAEHAERRSALRASALEWWRTSGGAPLVLPEPVSADRR